MGKNRLSMSDYIIVRTKSQLGWLNLPHSPTLSLLVISSWSQLWVRVSSHS